MDQGQRTVQLHQLVVTRQGWLELENDTGRTLHGGLIIARDLTSAVAQTLKRLLEELLGSGPFDFDDWRISHPAIRMDHLIVDEGLMQPMPLIAAGENAVYFYIHVQDELVLPLGVNTQATGNPMQTKPRIAVVTHVLQGRVNTSVVMPRAQYHLPPLTMRQA